MRTSRELSPGESETALLLDSITEKMASILVVCTGNICRSPIAEGFLRQRFRERGADPRIDVASCGTWGWEGSGAVPESVAVAEESEIDISGHVARRLVPDQILEADLVVGMTAEHRDAAMSMVPEASGKIFTLKEMVRLVEKLPDPPTRDASPDELVARVREADVLRRSGFEGLPGDEDVIDPLGLPIATFRAVAWEIGEFSRRLVDGLFETVPTAESPQPLATEEPPA